MNDSNDNSLFVMGGFVAFIVLAFTAVKAIGQFFKELKIAFLNFGQMVGAFIPMLWNCLIVVALISAIVAAIGTSIWFCISYFRMIKNIKEARSQLEYEVTKMKTRLSGELANFDKRISTNLDFVRQELTAFQELLIEATEKPDLPPTELASMSKNEAAMAPSAMNLASILNNQNTDTSPSNEVQMSNPF